VEREGLGGCVERVIVTDAARQANSDANGSGANGSGANGSGRAGSDCTTQGVRVEVTPEFLRDQGEVDSGRYLFAYRIRITNVGERVVQLLRRHWTIVDADGDTREVVGDGVVGRQPLLEPGESFEYASYCPLGTRWGTMEGWYTFAALDGVSLVDGHAAAAEGVGKGVGRAGGAGSGSLPLDEDAVPEPLEFAVRIARFFLIAPEPKG
jgi:ApaG protein